MSVLVCVGVGCKSFKYYIILLQPTQFTWQRFCTTFLKLTRFLQQLEHAARGFIGDGSLSLQLVFPDTIPSGDLVFGLDQNQSGLVHQFKNLLRLSLIQLLTDLQF